MDEEAIVKRTREIAQELGITYGTAMLLAVSERGEAMADVFTIDEDGNSHPVPLTPLEPYNP